MVKHMVITGIMAIGLMGCQATQQHVASLSFTNNEHVKLLLPIAKEDSKNKVKAINDNLNRLQGLSYSMSTGNKRQYINKLEWDFQTDNFTAKKTVCLRTSTRVDSCSGYSFIYITLKGGITFENVDESLAVTIIPKSGVRTSSKNMISGKPAYPNVKYGISKFKKAILGATLPWVFEVDSPYSPESVYANFQRLSRLEAYSGGAKKDPVSGKIYSERFWLTTSAGDIQLHIETYPYREGTKAVITAKVKPIISKDGTVDFESSVKELEEKLESIVKS